MLSPIGTPVPEKPQPITRPYAPTPKQPTLSLRGSPHITAREAISPAPEVSFTQVRGRSGGYRARPAKPGRAAEPAARGRAFHPERRALAAHRDYRGHQRRLGRVLVQHGGVQSVHRSGQLHVAAQLQVGPPQPPNKVETLGRGPVLRQVQQVQERPMGVRRPRPRRLSAQVRLDHHRPAHPGHRSVTASATVDELRSQLGVTVDGSSQKQRRQYRVVEALMRPLSSSKMTSATLGGWNSLDGVDLPAASGHRPGIRASGHPGIRGQRASTSIRPASYQKTKCIPTVGLLERGTVDRIGASFRRAADSTGAFYGQGLRRARSGR